MINNMHTFSDKVRTRIIREFYQLQKSPHHQLIRTEGVSYPRSGHSAIYMALRIYFGCDYVYCADLGKKNCGCGTVPCTNPNVLFSKNHDFEVLEGPGVEIIPDQQYIVQYRNPIRSIISNYRLFMVANPDKPVDRYWFPFARTQMRYWIQFIDKWVLNDSVQPGMIHYTVYENLMENPEASLTQIVNFITKENPDRKRLRRALNLTNIRPRNRIKDFKFYDRDFFLELESAAGDRLKTLSIPTFEESA